MSSIIDNRDDNTLLAGLRAMSHTGREISIATAFFSLDGLLLLAHALGGYERVRILFGDDADATQRRRLMEMLRQRSDADLLAQRDTLPRLSPLQAVEALFAAGRVEARCYTSKKFHAKAYLVHRPANSPPKLGIIGSGNFTRAGLNQNIELNVKLYEEQTAHLETWFEERWAEASADVVTEDVLAEIRRQIDLYEPHVLYLKALLTWGERQQDTDAKLGSVLAATLDPHQEQAYRQALTLLQRQHGVMLCDGVGLGKSFVALALMETLCRAGKNILLVAPKSILASSWGEYLATYLSRYRAPFGSIVEMPMTAFGFDAEDDQARAEELERLAERADVLVIDESHNFRTTSAARYENLLKIAAPSHKGRKAVILLTATPINTAYRDLSSQLSLITHDGGSIGGYSAAQIRRAASELDKGGLPAAGRAGQLSLELLETPSATLRAVLGHVLIQRSRATCKALAASAGKDLRFPKRSDPQVMEYQFDAASHAYADLIALTDRRFRPGVTLFQKLQAEIRKAGETGKIFHPEKLLRSAPPGIKLAAFLTEQYRRVPETGSKVYQDEVHLAGLVFSNTLKQLESSPPAFQGIIQSLSIGLMARLKVALGDEAAAPLLAPHLAWVRTSLAGDVAVAETDTEAADELADDGDSLDASGGEPDDWLAQAVRERGLTKKLAGFTDDVFDVARWVSDITADLSFLQEIHAATLAARAQPDPKLRRVLAELKTRVEHGQRILVFTQSQRTASYLEREMRSRLAGFGVARIDSRVETTRAAILHSFSPGYNPNATAPSVPERVDVLICTDVLSEGVNLQEAGAIVNYDIHWNPVRLIQRIGRVDRRLNPAITPDTHEFAILNVLPPPEIEDIIGLVGAVENRTIKISRTLGLDQSFFKASDPSGSLIEFNAQYDGHLSDTDRALTRFVSLTTVAPPDERTQRLVDAVPPGAFGVWNGAPHDGLFALWTLEATPKATDADRDKFSGLLGQPVLALQQASDVSFDAGAILQTLSATTPGEPSATPSDETKLAADLKSLKNAVRGRFRDINLPQSIVPRLVCWMELRTS